jgi:hypothetical protein
MPGLPPPRHFPTLPAYLKIGKSVIYDEDELDRFLAACRRHSTSEPDDAEQKNVDRLLTPRAATDSGEPQIAPKVSRPRRSNVTGNAAGRGAGR